MKKLYYILTCLFVAFLLVFACKKKEPIANETLTLNDLSSERTALTTTTGGSTTGGSTTGGTTTGGSTTGGSTTGGSTTGGVTTLSWMFWTDPNVLLNSGGGIYIYIDGSYAGTISQGYSSKPSCGTTGCLTKSTVSGTHTWYAIPYNQQGSWGSASNPRSTNVSSSTGCATMQLTM